MALAVDVSNRKPCRMNYLDKILPEETIKSSHRNLTDVNIGMYRYRDNKLKRILGLANGRSGTLQI